MLEKITKFADNAHGSQTRKYTPDRYIVHPIRVMNICKEYTEDETVLAAALLHDVLEDTETSEDDIYQFLVPLMGTEAASQALKLVIELTDVYIKKDYPKLNRRQRKTLERERISKTSARAQTIKYADILDNCTEIVAHDPSFAKVFLYECRELLRVMTSGNKELLIRTQNTLDEKIKMLRKK